jgi:hypothetical protein
MLVKESRMLEVSIFHALDTNAHRIVFNVVLPDDESGAPQESADAPHLEPAQLWRLIGGLQGLEVLEKNGDVLIELAFYLQQWHPEVIVIAERLRLDARELKWHVARLKGAIQTGNLQVSFPFYAQRAVVAYYLMTRRVLDLYQMVNRRTHRSLYLRGFGRLASKCCARKPGTFGSSTA